MWKSCGTYDLNINLVLPRALSVLSQQLRIVALLWVASEALVLRGAGPMRNMTIPTQAHAEHFPRSRRSHKPAASAFVTFAGSR